MQSRDWILTINNPVVEDVSTLFNEDVHRSFVGQYERGESGNLHIQGAISYRRSVRLARVRRDFPGCHAETRRGTRAQLLAYVTKEETREGDREPWHFGEPFDSGQGKRTDIDGAIQLVREGGIAALQEESPAMFLRFPRGFTELAFRYQSAEAAKDRDLRVVLLYGLPGCGKTRSCYRIAGDRLYSMDHEGGGSIWWDGYAGEDTLLLDDFYGWIPYHIMLRLLDRYKLRLPVKGGHTWARWKYVFITSNSPPRAWYSQDKIPDIAALMRRINIFIDMGVMGYSTSTLNFIVDSFGNDAFPKITDESPSPSS